MRPEDQPAVGFAPDDLTDGRSKGDWQTGYPERRARRGIGIEACYLALLLFLVPLLLFGLWIGALHHFVELSARQDQVLVRYAYAWLGGVFGGTVFSIKWLYHSVAHRMWHEDRRLWRLFTPHISGALAFAVMLMMSSGILKLFDKQSLGSPSMNLAMSFLVGYFSDNAAAKLTEVAETLFGTTRRPSREHAERGEPKP